MPSSRSFSSGTEVRRYPFTGSRTPWLLPWSTDAKKRDELRPIYLAVVVVMGSMRKRSTPGMGSVTR